MYIVRILLFSVLLCCFSSLNVFAEDGNTEVWKKYYIVIYNQVAEQASLDSNEANWIAQGVLYYASLYQVDPLLIAALLQAESNFNVAAYSPAGAIGIAQLMPETAAQMGLDPYDPLQNMEGGVRYLRYQLDRFSWAGNMTNTYAIAAYNAGPGAVLKYNDVPPYAETCKYVTSIAHIYTELLNKYKYL